MHLKSRSFETLIDRLDDAEEPGSPDKALRGLQFDKNYNYFRRPSKLKKQRWNFWICNSDVQDSGSEIDEDEKDELKGQLQSNNTRVRPPPPGPSPPRSRHLGDRDAQGLADFMTISDLSSRATPARSYQSARTRSQSSQSSGTGGNASLSEEKYPRQLGKETENRLRSTSQNIARGANTQAHRPRKKGKHSQAPRGRGEALERNDRRMRGVEIRYDGEGEQTYHDEEEKFENPIGNVGTSHTHLWREGSV